MKAVTVQPGVAGSVRLEEVPEPDESFSKVDASLGLPAVLLEPTTVVAKAREPVGAMRARAFWVPHHFYRAAEALAAADRDWLARPISRRVPPKNIADALRRGPDDIEVVVDFGA